MDRTILTCKEFVRNTAEMGPPFVEPVTDTIEMIFDEMVGRLRGRTWIGRIKAGWGFHWGGCGRKHKHEGRIYLGPIQRTNNYSGLLTLFPFPCLAESGNPGDFLALRGSRPYREYRGLGQTEKGEVGG